MGGNTNYRMRDLTENTLLRLCGEKQGDVQTAWSRLSTGLGLISKFDNDIIDKCCLIKDVLDEFENILMSATKDRAKNLNASDNKQTIIDLHEYINKIHEAKNLLLELLEDNVTNGQKPIYLWDVISFDCDELKAKAVLSYLFPNDEQLFLNVKDFVDGYNMLNEQCKKETADSDNLELAQQRWWKKRNKLVNCTSYGVYNMSNDKITIDMNAFPSKSMAIRRTLEFIVNVPSYFDEQFQTELYDISAELERIHHEIGNNVQVNQIKRIMDDNFYKCLTKLKNSVFGLYRREIIRCQNNNSVELVQKKNEKLASQKEIDTEKRNVNTSPKKELTKDKQLSLFSQLPEDFMENAEEKNDDKVNTKNVEEMVEKEEEEGDIAYEKMKESCGNNKNSDNQQTIDDKEIEGDNCLDYKAFLTDAQRFFDRCNLLKHQIADAFQKTECLLKHFITPENIIFWWEPKTQAEDIEITIYPKINYIKSNDLEIIKKTLEVNDFTINVDEKGDFIISCTFKQINNIS